MGTPGWLRYAADVGCQRPTLRGGEVADRASTAAAQRAGCGQRRFPIRGGRADRAHQRAHDTAVSDFPSLSDRAPVRYDWGMQKCDSDPVLFPLAAKGAGRADQAAGVQGSSGNRTLTPIFAGRRNSHVVPGTQSRRRRCEWL